MPQPTDDFGLLPATAMSDWLKQKLPADIQSRPFRYRLNAAAKFVTRHIFTGAPDALEMAGGETNGLNVLAWWQVLEHTNCGLGPLTMCGHMVYPFVAICAMLDIYARWIGAVGPDGPDNQAEVWNPGTLAWEFINLSNQSWYVDTLTRAILSYRSMSQLARNGQSDRYILVTATGERALHPEGDKYGRWEHFLDDAVVGRGNRSQLGQPCDWMTWRMWPPKPGQKSLHHPAYVEDNPPMHLAYPDLSSLSARL